MKSEITTTGTRIVYENRWMRVREDTILRADGSPGLYGVVEKPDFVVVAPVQNGFVHLVQQYRYPVRARFWELPQGSWEHLPDADPLDVARAELAEETGLSAAEMRYVGHLFEAYGYSNQGYHVFVASGLRQGTPKPEGTEQDLVSRPFPLGKFEAMVRDGAIKDATTIATFGLLMLKGII